MDEEADLDSDVVAEHEVQCKVSEIDKAERRSPWRMRNWWRKPARDEVARPGKERGTGKATLMCDKPPEKLVETIDGLGKIKAFQLQRVDREAGNEVALGTSKISYLDPS